MNHRGYGFLGFIYNPIEFDETPSNVIEEDGYWGTTTTRFTQSMLDTIQDGVISGQYLCDRKYLPNCLTSSWKYSANGSKSGSTCIKEVQKLVGLEDDDIDGYCGPQTVKKIQSFLKEFGLYQGQIDGYMGYYTVVGWQKYINKYFLS